MLKSLTLVLGAFALASAQATSAQGLPGSGDSGIGGGFDFNQYYVGAGPCSASCFRLAPGTTTPTWSVEARNPLGTQTIYDTGVVLWDEDDDGNDEPVDMSLYRLEADVVGAVPTGDGKVTVVIELTTIEISSQEVVNQENITKVYNQSALTGNSDN